MKKPKSTMLEKAKERFVDNWGWFIDDGLGRTSCAKRFRRQLNNLIRLAKAEGRKGK